jgi:hypothetical protein
LIKPAEIWLANSKTIDVECDCVVGSMPKPEAILGSNLSLVYPSMVKNMEPFTSP